MIITKKEFINYVKNFNKMPGEFTRDEMIEIGIKAKTSLIRKDRKWDELNNLVGYSNGDGNAYRCLIKNFMRKHSSLLNNEDIILNRLDKKAKNSNNSNLQQAYLEKIKELKLQQIKTRDATREYNSCIRSDARYQVLQDELISALSKYRPLPIIEYKKSKNAKAESILILNDWHIGCNINNFYNKFNVKIAEKRISKLLTNTIEYIKKFNIKKLNIINLGDMIEGEIHITARVENELDSIHQIIKVSELLAQFINKLSYFVPEIDYRSCIGNHDRVIQNYKESLANDNFIPLIDEYIKLRLINSHITNVNFPEDNLSPILGFFELDNGRTVGFSHGDMIKLDSAFQNVAGATKQFPEYIILGHLHNMKMKEFDACCVIQASSLKGSDEYSLTKSLFSKPSQTLLILDELDNDLIFKINLN